MNFSLRGILILLVAMCAQYICMAQPAMSDAETVTIEVYAYLEGAYDPDQGLMRNKLNSLGYLPGQQPKAFFAKRTSAGQPYAVSPWLYSGKEGAAKENIPYQYPLDAVDWVLVSLRETPAASSEVYRATAFLLNDGRVVMAPESKDCVVNTAHSYYIVIEHRNHLAVMSDGPVPVEGGALYFDFTSESSYQDGQKMLDAGVYAMYAGDINHDNHAVIDEGDIQLWKEANGQNSSYYGMDLDLSGDVSIADQTFIYANMGIKSTVPR